MICAVGCGLNMHEWIENYEHIDINENVVDYICKNCSLKAFTFKGKDFFWIDFSNTMEVDFGADANDISCDELIIKNIIE